MAQEVAIRRQDVASRPLAELQELGRVFYESGMFPDVRSAAQAVVKIQAGSELGFSPIYSMAKIYIVKGRVMVGAEAIGALIKRSGRYDYRVVKLTDTECELMFTDNGNDVYRSLFTMEDARRADLVTSGSGWYKWPRAMLMSKTLSQGARIVCPHIISGVYVPEDFGLELDDQRGTDAEGVVLQSDEGKEEVITPLGELKPEASAGSAMETDKTDSSGVPNKATPSQIRKIMASARGKGCEISEVGVYMKERWQIASMKGLTKSQASELIDLIEAGKLTGVKSAGLPLNVPEDGEGTAEQSD